MKFQQLSICICITIALLVVATSAEKGKGKGKWKGEMKNMTCKGEPLQMKDKMEEMKACMSGLSPPTEQPLPEDKDERRKIQMERMKNMRGNTCVDVCSKKKQGILSADGTLNQSGMETFVKSNFPEKAQTEMIAGFKTCYDASFKSATPSMDNKCESYKDFSKCTKMSFFKVCEIKMGKMGKKGGKKDKKGEEEGSMESGSESEE